MTRTDPTNTNRPEGVGARYVWLLALAAVLLRIVLLLGRGDYLAFDEGWYLLLARSLFTGDGYSLIGLPHVALSPLFPILAGAVGTVLNSWVWGGRLVGAVASGLLVVPAWAVFRRLAPARTAFIAAGLVAVLPSLAPFVVPFWIGADLWVGAEPLLHLLLYTGLALWLRADEEGRGLMWFLTGGAFGLAFLARPEAIIAWGLLGLAALATAARRRAPRQVGGAALMGFAFLLVAAPYWTYLHQVTGQWSLTGRGVRAAAAASRLVGVQRGTGAAGTIERMLWQDDQEYAAFLYSLDDSGERLRAGYWGVYPDTADRPATSGDRGETAAPVQEAVPPATTREDDTAQAEGEGTAGGMPRPGAPAGAPSAVGLYVRSLGIIFPLLLWPFALLGVVQPRDRAALRPELAVAGALTGTSLAIAAIVAVDPRTQLFLVPLLALYAARGFSLVDETVRSRWAAGPRPGFLELLLAGTAVIWLLGTNARRLYLSVSLGSPHHIVGAQNRDVARELDSLLGTETGPVASWHPALALFADRDWRVLPLADLSEIVRYEQAAGAEVMILSAYYPPDLGVENLGTRYLVLPVPESDGELRPWTLHLVRGDSIRALGRLEPARPDTVGRPQEEPSIGGAGR